jgi:hypothetical protein
MDEGEEVMAKVTVELSGPTNFSGKSRDALGMEGGGKGRRASATKAPAPTRVAPAEPVEVSDKDLAKEHARFEKRRATERWISGQLKTTEHERIHRRADHVLKGKAPRQFKGITGERKDKW